MNQFAVPGPEIALVDEIARRAIQELEERLESNGAVRWQHVIGSRKRSVFDFCECGTVVLEVVVAHNVFKYSMSACLSSAESVVPYASPSCPALPFASTL